jgi:prolipoprotein diacylglyceryltransferase
MTEEKQLTEKESLELIASMISKAKNSYIESGIGPLVWGILITFCSLVTYFQIEFQFELPFDIWLISLFALLPQAYFSFRQKKPKSFISHDESMMNYVWGTFAICIFMLSFYTNKTNSGHNIALYMMIYGIPTFITGGIRKFKPMIFGGLICWACSITSYYVGSANGMLLMSLSAISAWLVPGIILRSRYLKLKHV